MNKNKEMVESFFHSYAVGFDSIYGNGEKRSLFNRIIDKLFRKSMRQRFSETLNQLKDNDIETVLDVGSGSGRYVYEINNLGLHVTGIDMAEGMIEIAKNVNKSGIDNGQVDFIFADYMDCHFNKKFDVVVLMGLFDYIQEPGKLVEKLKKDVNSIILASFPKSEGWLAWQRLIRYKIKKCPLYLYSKEDVQSLMSNSRINNYEIINLDREYFLIAKL